MSFQDDDDDFDMFALPSSETESKVRQNSGVEEAGKSDTHQQVKHAADHADAEGYFNAPPGTLLNNDYLVCGELGKGVFSTVYLVKRTNPPGKVGQEIGEHFCAAKISRANEVMYKAGQRELRILREIGTHPHILNLIEFFELDSASSSSTPHLILVFEKMGMNLRDTLNKFGQNTGLSLEAVRTFGAQLFSALGRLRELSIVHADFKPDNILISSDFRRCVLGDFGSAFHLTDPEASLPTPYLVSRYYRAPEIILGLEYGCEADVWSLGCTLYELYTGSVLFSGHTNNDMLRLFHTTLGRFPNNMLRKHIQQYTQKLELEPHFTDPDLRFKLHERDPITGSIIRRLVKIPDHPQGPQSLRGLVLKKSIEEEDEDDEDDGVSGGSRNINEAVLDFAECLVQCLTLDPRQRLDPRVANTKLSFFTGRKQRERKLPSASDDGDESAVKRVKHGRFAPGSSDE